jgi:protocatechuate 3,4-dioxygenase, alpha subunit
MMAELRQTPSQTIGPFFHGALQARDGADRSDARGERIEIFGRVLDGDGVGVSDALIEIWQAGLERGSAGFAGSPTDEDGRFAFRTMKPRPVAGRDGVTRAPHLAVGVFARGLLNRLVTRVYFEDATENDRDLVLSLVPAGRRHTLIAKRVDEPNRYRIDIVLQGSNETVFFDV